MFVEGRRVVGEAGESREKKAGELAPSPVPPGRRREAGALYPAFGNKSSLASFLKGAVLKALK